MGIPCEKQERVRRPALRVYTLRVENGVAGVKEKTETLPLLSGAQVLDLAGHLGYLILQTLRRGQGRWSVEKKKTKHRQKSQQMSWIFYDLLIPTARLLAAVRANWSTASD